jgi:hypothetical protein
MTLRRKKGGIGQTPEGGISLDTIKRSMHEWTSELDSLRDGDYKIRSVIHKGYPILNDLRRMKDITVSEREKNIIKDLIKKINREMDKARLRA